MISVSEKFQEPIIKVSEPTEIFDDVKAVDIISFDVHKEKLFGFLGADRAGKTAAVNMLAGFVRPDSGTIHHRRSGMYKKIGSYTTPNRNNFRRWVAQIVQ